MYTHYKWWYNNIREIATYMINIHIQQWKDPQMCSYQAWTCPWPGRWSAFRKTHIPHRQIFTTHASPVACKGRMQQKIAAASMDMMDMGPGQNWRHGIHGWMFVLRVFFGLILDVMIIKNAQKSLDIFGPHLVIRRNHDDQWEAPPTNRWGGTSISLLFWSPCQQVDWWAIDVSQWCCIRDIELASIFVAYIEWLFGRRNPVMKQGSSTLLQVPYGSRGRTSSLLARIRCLEWPKNWGPKMEEKREIELI